MDARATKTDEAELAAGHRARLRQRLLDGGPQGFHDYELLEYLLTLTIPRVDTKPLAKKLLEEFGGIGPLLQSSADTLRREGLSDPTIAALKIAEATALRLLEARIEKQPVLSSWDALGATALIIVHNHPSGDPTPSSQDIRLTRDLVEAGRHMKVTVHDHVIVGAQGRTSMRAIGLI